MKIEKKYNLGISLSGGGAKGFAHLGVLQALNEHNLFPEIISGTSAGAFAGVLYADGNSPEECINLFKKKKFGRFAKLTVPGGGFFNTTPFNDFLKHHLKAKTFEDLKVDLHVVTTNIEDGKIKVFNSGSLIEPVVASCAVPIVFKPVQIDNKHYVDGGLVKKFPVSIIRKKCEKIIGVNVSPAVASEYKNSINYVAERSFSSISNSNVYSDSKLCDYLLESEKLSKYAMFDLKHIEEIFELGYEITQQFLVQNAESFKRDFPQFV